MNKQVANSQLMQKMNRLKVLNYVRRHPNASRPVIAKETGLSLPSITNIITYLTSVGILHQSGTEVVTRAGRKSALLRLNPSLYDFLCIYFGENSVVLARTDLEGNILETTDFSIQDMSSDTITEKLCDNALNFVNASSKILAIGIAISGLVLPDNRFVMSARHKWKSFDIVRVLNEKTNIPVFVDNTSLLKAVYYFAKNDTVSKENTLFVDLENGVGAVQYLNGTIIKATTGEIGHTTVDKDGPPCFCGNRGCLEALCSPRQIVSLYKELSGHTATLKEIEHLQSKGDKCAREAILHCGQYLGIGLQTLVNLFNPSVIVINTGDYTDCPSLIDAAAEEMKRRAYTSLTDNISLVYNNTKTDAILGITYNLFDKVFDIAFPHNIIE